jgi:hypothetical protein
MKERDFFWLLAVITAMCFSVIILVAVDIYREPQEEIKCAPEQVWKGERFCHTAKDAGLYCSRVEIKHGKRQNQSL